MDKEKKKEKIRISVKLPDKYYGKKDENGEFPEINHCSGAICRPSGNAGYFFNKIKVTGRDWMEVEECVMRIIFKRGKEEINLATACLRLINKKWFVGISVRSPRDIDDPKRGLIKARRRSFKAFKECYTRLGFSKGTDCRIIKDYGDPLKNVSVLFSIPSDYKTVEFVEVIQQITVHTIDEVYRVIERNHTDDRLFPANIYVNEKDTLHIFLTDSLKKGTIVLN